MCTLFEHVLIPCALHVCPLGMHLACLVWLHSAILFFTWYGGLCLMTWSPALHCGARLPALAPLTGARPFFHRSLFCMCSRFFLRVVSSPLGCALLSSGQARSFMVVEAASFHLLTLVTALAAPP